MDWMKVAAMSYCFLGLLLLSFALSSDVWIKTVDQHFGLWVICKRKRCSALGKKVEEYIVATRTLALIAAILSSVSLFATFVSIQFPHVDSESLTKLSVIPAFLAGACIMVAMAVFTGAGQRHTAHNGNFSNGYVMGWISGFILFISGVISSQRLPPSPEHGGEKSADSLGVTPEVRIQGVEPNHP